MTESHKPRVYLAGPDVFERDAAARFTELVRLAHGLGLAPIVPMEGWGNAEPQPADAHSGPAGRALAQRIFAANIERLNGAAGVVANLADFRGTEPDSGTVFEVGYAVARGIPVVGYGVPAVEYATRVGEYLPTARTGDTLRERGGAHDGREVESFGQPLNLMLACSLVSIEADAAAALAVLARRLKG